MPELDIILEPVPPELMLPDYKYTIKGSPQSEESSAMYESLVQFLKTNEELILQSSSPDIKSYIDGFKKGVALARLWIEVIHLKP